MLAVFAVIALVVWMASPALGVGWWGFLGILALIGLVMLVSDL